MGRYSGKRCRLISMFSLTAAFFLVELVVGYITNSMALVADSFHMLSDVASLVIAFLSVKMSPKKWSKNTFGWARAEVLGALVNSIFLVALCFSILVESLKRFYEVETIHDPQLLLIVGSVGLAINIIGMFLFHQHGHSHGGHGHSHGGHGHSHSGSGGHGHSHLSQFVAIDDNDNDDTFPPPVIVPSTNKKEVKKNSSQLNMHGVFLHVMADALGSIVVIVSALLIWLTEWEYKDYIDPALSIAMVVIILISTWPLLQESAMILLQTVPTHIQVDAMQRKLLTQVDGVLAVHEFHVWQLAGDRIIASAHIRCRNLADYMKIAERVKEFFHNEGIHSTTIQPEFVEVPGDISEAESCALDCSTKDKTCAASTCCGPSKQGNPAIEQNGCRQRNSANVNSADIAHSNCPESDHELKTCDGNLSCLESGAHVHTPLIIKE